MMVWWGGDSIAETEEEARKWRDVVGVWCGGGEGEEGCGGFICEM